MNKVTGEQVSTAMYKADVNNGGLCNSMADELNKLLENEPTNEAILSLYNALDKRIDAVFLINKQAHEYLTEVMKQMNRSWSEDVKELTDKLDKIQEQLTSLAGENISKQFVLFLEKQAKRDSDILREIAILDEKVKKRWGDNYRVEFNIDPECGSGSVKFLVNDSMESIDDFHKKDNYESARNTSIHALVTIDWDKFEQSPQKETQEKSCVTCKNYEYCYNKNGPMCDSKNCKFTYNHWQPKQESR